MRGIAVWIVLMLTTPLALANETGKEVYAPERGQDRISSESASSPDDWTQSGPLDFRRFSANYFAIFYGPGLQNPSSLQPSPDGTPDPDKPVHLKNFFTVGYNINESMGISGTAYWIYRPVRGQQFMARDPFLRFVHASIFRAGDFNLYGDARVHFGVSSESRNNDMIGGVQAFQILSYNPGQGAFTFDLIGSARYNYFGTEGIGTDGELYLGPMASYKVGKSVTLSLLYEMGASHAYGADAFEFESDGQDLQPSVHWAITQNFAVNPYLTLYPSKGFSAKSSSFGMTVSWTLL